MLSAFALDDQADHPRLLAAGPGLSSRRRRALRRKRIDLRSRTAVATQGGE